MNGKKNYFKICSSCNYVWKSRDDFLNDSNVTIVGYQKNYEDLRAGLFLFNHSCKTTFSIAVHHFEDLYDGPVFKERESGAEKCPGHCLRSKNLKPCPIQCECAFVREIIQKLKNDKD